MSDEHDYLWTGEGPVSLEVAGIERELRSLAWRPRELVLPEVAAPLELRQRRTSERATTRGWLPFVAGLAAAAAVLVALASLRDRGEAPNEAPTPIDSPAQPSGSPSPDVPDLKDPFTSEGPDVPTPSADPPKLVDPFANQPQQAPTPPISPDSPNLKDPFSAAGDQPKQQPREQQTPSPDLADPWAKTKKSAPKVPGKLYDPFAGEQREPSNSSPDLKDPFSR